MYDKFISKNYKELMEIINCLKVGVYITDADGNTLMLNDESCKTGGLTREEVIGKNMAELEEIGFVENSVTLKTLKSGQEEVIIQNLGDGNEVFVTGVPLYNGNKIEAIICTERDITETLELKQLLEEKDKDRKQKDEELEYLKKQNIIMWGDMIAEEERTKQLVEKAMRIAKLNVTVLLTGESGTGKEVFANFIYQNSSRVGKPFIKVNCAAIPENLMESELFGYEKGAFTGAGDNGKRGLFEMANGGTLFLDEIGEVPLHLQSKLLRAIQEKTIMHVGGVNAIPIDIRLITATNRDLKKAVEEKTFREDLYYRLNVMPIELLPLRGRKKDIKALAITFVNQFNKTYKMDKVISDEAIEALQQFEWPGNIRELENIIERIMISFDGNIINRFQVERAMGLTVPPLIESLAKMEGKGMKELADDYECYVIRMMLDKYGRASDAARALNMNKSTFSRRMEKYHLNNRHKSDDK